MFAIFAISAGLTYTLGRMTGSQKHGWAVFGAMAVLFLAGILVSYWAEARGNPIFPANVDQVTSATQSGGNMEGKEVRFGIANSTLWATITTDASCGAVNSMHDSYTPLGGLVPLANIMLSEVIFGGVGAGMYGILIYVVLSVFIAGLMVGRTPEYLGKKIEAYDVKMAMLDVLIFPLTILVFTAISSVSHGLRNLAAQQRGAAWAVRDSLRLHVGHGQQRIGVRRDFGEHLLVQHDHRHRDAARALLHDHPDAGDRGQPGAEEGRAAVPGHVPGHDAALHDAAGKRDPDRWRADLLPGA